MLSAPRIEAPSSVLGAKRKASAGTAPDGSSGQPPWETRRPPPPSASTGQTSVASAPPPPLAPPPPPPPQPRFTGAYPAQQALPQGYARAHSRNGGGGEWGDHPTFGSPRTPAFGTSPSTSQGAGSENDSLHLGLFPDWETGFGDPTMTLFPSGSGDDYWQGNGPDSQQPLPAGYTAGYPGPPPLMADGRFPHLAQSGSHHPHSLPPPPQMQGSRPSVANPQEYPPPPQHVGYPPPPAH